jgi:hypothetical protein
VQLVMAAEALLGDDDTPAEVVGYGPVPASVARRLVRDAPDGAEVWVRWLHADAPRGGLVAMESRARSFPAALRRFLVLRDEVCRTPWCDAPVRHTDHVVAHAEGGATSVGNGQGLCVRCNQVKESRGWTAQPGPDGTVVTTTPTGHQWHSWPRNRWGPPPDTEQSPGEQHVRQLLQAA